MNYVIALILMALFLECDRNYLQQKYLQFVLSKTITPFSTFLF